MTTSNTRTNAKTTTPDFEAASEQIRAAGDRFLAASRTMTSAYLDGVERYVAGVAKAERKIGEQSRIDAFGQLLNVHATLTEDVAKASLSATRELISA
ncbi:MAG: hypothetical protein ACRDPM_02925 [Solirubrobacteraceae bacterium]